MKIKNSIFISMVLTAVLLAVLWIICPICFQNNDDKVIMYLTAGYTTGKPAMGTVFGGFLWAHFIGLLYRLYAGVSWYTLVTLAAIAVSTVFICHGFIISTGSGFKEKIIGITSFVAIFLFSLMYFSTALQYTVTATIVGCAAIVTAATYDYMVSNAWQIANIVASAILITCSYSIRKQMGILSISAVLIILFFELFGTQARDTIKRGTIICLAFAIVMGSNVIYEKVTGIADFNDYYAEAGQWIDYPHLDIADDTDGVYESTGWDEQLYNAASRWYFMDERLTTENFATINAGYSSDLTIKEKVVRFIGLISPSEMCSLQVLVWIILLIIFNAKEIINRRLNLKAITIDALFLLFAAVSLYFGLIQGRFPLRVYEALLLVYFVPSLVLMLQIQSEAECQLKGECKLKAEYKFKALIPTIIGLAIVLSTVAYPSASMLINTYNTCHDGSRDEEVLRANTLEQYAIAHKENVYVYDYELSLPADPFTTYTDGTPNNVLFWGGWTYNTPMYYEQLASNGLDHIYASDLIDGNIFICGVGMDETIVDYMHSIDSTTEPEIIDEFDGIIIYRFTRE